MKHMVLTVGVVTALLLGGPAFAQGPGYGPPGMQDEGGMGPGMMRQRMMRQMGRGMGMMHGMGAHDHMGGMHGPMGRGMMGPGMMGPGMMGMHHGSATASERDDLRTLFLNHDLIRRTVTNLPDGIRTVTESDDARTAAVIKRHVADMGKRVEQGRDPNLPIESDALRAIFRNKDKIKSAYEVTAKGVVVVQTSADAETVRLLQTHAAEVSELARRGMVAAHEAMMRNGGMMRGMHGPMGGRAR